MAITVGQERRFRDFMLSEARFFLVAHFSRLVPPNFRIATPYPLLILLNHLDVRLFSLLSPI